MSKTTPRFASPVFKVPPDRVNPKITVINKITDLYFHDGVDETHPNAPKPRGEGAYGFSGQAQVIRFAGTELSAWVDCVAELIKTEFPYEEDFKIHIDGVTWRCCRDINSASSEISMRQIVTEIPRLADLTINNNALVNLMQHSFLNDGGLVLIGGLTGSGKTTLCGGFLRSRLERFAGRCVSVEDPIELPLEGFIGDGVVRQMVVDYSEHTDPHRRGFPGALRRSYRKYPSVRPAILYVGEVRDEETAVELLKASSNGMLVVTTIHSENPISSIRRLAGMASTKLGSGADLLLAASLRLSVHSSLDWRAGQTDARTGRPKAIMSLNAVFSSGESHPVATHIRERKYNQINQSIETQRGIFTRASNAGSPASHIYEQLGGTEN